MFDWLTRRLREALPSPATAEPMALPVEIQKSADDLLFEALERFKLDLRSVERRQMEEHAKSIADDSKAIQRATEWVERAEIVWPLLNIYDLTRHWSSWLTNPSYKVHLELGLFDLSATRTTESGVNRTTTLFRLNAGGPCYSLTGEGRESTGDERLTYSVDGEDVLSIGLRREITEYPDNPYISSSRRIVHDGTVHVLRPGPWVSSILELDSRMRLQQQAKREREQAEKIAAQAAGLRGL